MTIHPAVAYTVGRLLIFIAVAAVLWLLGFRSWALVLVALLVSMPISLVVLRRQRLAFARDIARRRQHRRELRAKLRGDEPEP